MDTKIALSDKEYELVCNTEWILTKHAVIKKVYDLFGEILPLFEKKLHEKINHLPTEVFINSAKISKGENYKLLPYIMLDYPRYFSKEDTIAIRTFFWWGNFFSVSLQLGGHFKTKMTATLHQNFKWLQQNNYSICINDNVWEHHFDADNFVPIKTINEKEFEDILLGMPFVKIAKNISLQQWGDAPVFIEKAFAELAGLIIQH
jgi:hypothetical protein